MTPLNSLNNRSGNIILIVVLLSTLIIGSFLYVGLRYQSINRAILRTSTKNNLDALKEYLSAHTDCVKTRAQPCTDPITLLKRDNSVFLNNSVQVIGSFKIQTFCHAPSQAIFFRFADSKVAGFNPEKQQIVCPGP